MAKKRVKKGLITLLTIVLMLLFCFPVYMAFLTSLKTPGEVAASVLAIPAKLDLTNYAQAMEKSDFGRSLINSCIVTFPSVLLIVLCSSMAGYAIARNSQKHRCFRLLDKVFLGSLMIPFQILMIPIYKMYKSLNLMNNLGGIIIILTGTSVAYATYMYVGFVKSIPRELEESAMLDGCGAFHIFFSIIFPLLKPITVTVATLHVLWLWNDFNISIILLQKDEVRTLTVKQYYFFGEHTTNYGMAFAAAIICMIPVIIVFVLGQKHMVEGIASGAVKS